MRSGCLDPLLVALDRLFFFFIFFAEDHLGSVARAARCKALFYLSGIYTIKKPFNIFWLPGVPRTLAGEIDGVEIVGSSSQVAEDQAFQGIYFRLRIYCISPPRCIRASFDLRPRYSYSS